MILSIDHVLWVYKAIIAEPTLWGCRLEFHICAMAERGTGFVLPFTTEQDADDFLAELIRRRPYAMVGFQMPWRELAGAGVTAVRAEVRQRKSQWEALPPDERASWLEARLDEAEDFVHRHDPQLHSGNPSS